MPALGHGGTSNNLSRLEVGQNFHLELGRKVAPEVEVPTLMSTLRDWSREVILVYFGDA